VINIKPNSGNLQIEMKGYVKENEDSFFPLVAFKSYAPGAVAKSALFNAVLQLVSLSKNKKNVGGKLGVS
jgi:hypothetical protein